MLAQISGYIKCFDKTKYMSFMMKDAKVLQAYNAMWNKVTCLMKKVLDSEPV